MSLLSTISGALYFAGAVAMATGFVLLGVFAASTWSRKRRSLREPERDFLQDATNIAILFQSMRDVLREQKTLAAELNRAMERNAAYVRETMEICRAESARAREIREELERRLQRSWSEAVAEPPAPKAEPADSAAAAPPMNGNGHHPHPETAERPVLNILSEPAPAESAPKETSDWVGIDFGPAVSGEPDYDAPETAPESPEDPQTARQAFRALLGMDEYDGERAALLGDTPVPKANGSSNGAPLLSERVYDYCDAGMTVHQIARELGIGKGEVRLILSLRKDKDGA